MLLIEITKERALIREEIGCSILDLQGFKLNNEKSLNEMEKLEKEIRELKGNCCSESLREIEIKEELYNKLLIDNKNILDNLKMFERVKVKLEAEYERLTDLIADY